MDAGGSDMKQDETMPPLPRPASTVILARQGHDGLEIYLLKRSRGSSFFPGDYVFPGGAVDRDDMDVTFWQGRVNLGSEEISERLGGGLSEEYTFGHAVSAIRETFEEAGVLLAHQVEDKAEEMERMSRFRSDGKLTKTWLKERVMSGGWALAFSRLARWAHWITPEAMKFRFDTRFYVALMPAGQVCRPDKKETTHGLWISPEGALSGNLQKEISLSPPTLVTLHEFLPYLTISELEVEAKRRPWGEARLPRLIKLKKGAVILQPWDPSIHEEPVIDEQELDDKVLPVGKTFSRLWLNDGVWRPVGY
jgi:8-oxo-dGTP pyrophosphatase MutT (NUDIX family)